MRLVVALGCCLLAAGCTSEPPVTSPATSSTNDAGQAPAPAVPGAAANPVTVKILSYEQIQDLLASHKGKVVVMDAWSTSCEPCLKEFPNLVALHRRHGPQKVACVSLSFDYEGLDSPESVKPKVEKFLAEQGAAFDNVISSLDSESLYKKFELASVPAVFVFDRDGKLVKRFDNERVKSPQDAFSYKNVEALVDELLAKAP